MKLTKQHSLRALCAAAILTLSAAAQATPLNRAFAGEGFLDTGLGGTTALARPELAGTVLVDLVQAFDFGALNVLGTVQSRVVRETTSGTLDFYWRVKVDPRSTGGSVSAFRLTNFGFDNIVDGDWREDGLGSTAPFTGRVFNPVLVPVGAINFLFTDPPIAPAKLDDPAGGSYFFFLHTDTTEYQTSASYDLLSVQDGHTGLYRTFAPGRGLPEPSALMLGVLGLGMMQLARKRRGLARSV